MGTGGLVLNPTPSVPSGPVPGPDSIVYVGPVNDMSGYGFAARLYVRSLIQRGYNLRVGEYGFASAKLESGLNHLMVSKNSRWFYDASVRIIHSPPRDFSRFRQEGRYNIGCTVWETDRLPDDWVKSCNEMDEIWVPCEDNLYWFKQSGVNKPVHVIPHITPSQEVSPQPPPEMGFLLNEQRVVFYNVFVWQKRKNPLGTLAAYFSAFTEKDPVLLVLKVDTTSPDSSHIDREIADLKRRMNLTDFPQIALLRGHFSDAEMVWLHKLGDCYFQLQHSEGWGLPHFEAVCHGNSLITTTFGGPRQFMLPEAIQAGQCLPIQGSMTPVLHEYQYYNGRQLWCEPDVRQAMGALQFVANRGKRSFSETAEIVRNFFSSEAIGQQMASRLSEILG